MAYQSPAAAFSAPTQYEAVLLKREQMAAQSARDEHAIKMDEANLEFRKQEIKDRQQTRDAVDVDRKAKLAETAQKNDEAKYFKEVQGREIGDIPSKELGQLAIDTGNTGDFAGPGPQQFADEAGAVTTGTRPLEGVLEDRATAQDLVTNNMPLRFLGSPAQKVEARKKEAQAAFGATLTGEERKDFEYQQVMGHPRPASQSRPDPSPVKVQYRDPKTGKNVERWVSPQEAQAMGQLDSPTPASVIVKNMGGGDGAPSSHDDVVLSVRGMKAGLVPPQLPGRATKDSTAIYAEATRQNFDMATANLDWIATTKHTASMNGTKFLSLRSSVTTAMKSLDIIQRLADDWQGGNYAILNRANLKLAQGGAYGPKAASIATQLEGQITDVTSELGNVFMGGNSPTDHALKLAEKNLKADWSHAVLTDMIGLTRENLQIRGNSLKWAKAVGASEGNLYGPRDGDELGEGRGTGGGGGPAAPSRFDRYMKGGK